MPSTALPKLIRSVDFGPDAGCAIMEHFLQSGF